MEEKLPKKTLLFMILGIVTLLVVVVGATFAYFTASNTASGQTSVSATTENLGAVTVSNPTTNMHLRLKAVNMSEQSGGTSYYATTTGSDYVESVEYNSVANIKVSGGEDATTYTCTYDLTISGSDVLEENDAKVIFKTESITNVSNLSIDGITPEEEIDLKTGANTYEVSFDVKGNMNETEMIKAGFKLNNLTTEQDHLKNKTLTFSVENSNLKCSVKAPVVSRNLSTTIKSLEGNGQVFNEGNVGYRYEGANVNNYVTFNNETWRIIGVEEGSKIGLTSGEYYTKIIREYDSSTDSTLFSLPYDSDNDHGYDWSTTSLYTLLNGDYYNRSGSYASVGLTSESKELIVDANWYYTPVGDYNSYTSSKFYTAERSDTTKVVKDAIGLMYPSDFGYAALQSACSSAALTSYNNGNICKEKDWLYNGNLQWTIIPHSSNASNALRVFASGNVSSGSANSGCAVRPVVYLDSDVVITNDGDGSVGNKFEVGK